MELQWVHPELLLSDHGFILTERGDRVHFHRNGVHEGLEFEKLREGQPMSFDIEAGVKAPLATVGVAAPPETPGP